MILKKGMFSSAVRIMQAHLTALGYDTNGVEGDFGSGTERAVMAYQRHLKLTADGIIGNATASAIALDFYSREVEFVPAWMLEAFKDYFVSEIKGEKHNPRVLQMWKDAKLAGIKDDETAWCAGAVSAWLERAGVVSQRTAWARNYAKQGTKVGEPLFGAIAVFERGSGGHVAFVTGVTADGSQIRCIGGNQSNTVNEAMFDVSRVIEYRSPDGSVLPRAPIAFAGEASKNEA